MDPSYKRQYPPDHGVCPKLDTFLETFYEISDTPGETDKYVDMFTTDATFILASKRAFGHEEIRKLREGMWDVVASRKHRIFKVFPFGQDSEEVMLYGTVALELKNGNSAEVDWAGRAELVRSVSDGKYRMKTYQVYLDTGGVAAYKNDP